MKDCDTKACPTLERVGSGVVFNVPAGQPFLKALARAILNGDLPRTGGGSADLTRLPDTTILLPTRRAARALQEHFLDLSCGRALLLPRIRAIAETNEDQSLISDLAVSAEGSDPDAVPDQVSELERHLVLTNLVMRWAEAMRDAAGRAGATSPDQIFSATGTQTAAQAINLARELAALMDMVETENVSLDALESLVPEDYSEHWQQTLKFLEIISVAWPAYLQERGLVSPATRRNATILAEARRLRDASCVGSVIVAGVTGSIPATAELMRVVARLEQGAIVLPGLDLVLDAHSWDSISGDPGVDKAIELHPEHPQFGLKRLIDAIGVDREDVAILPGAEPDVIARERLKFVSEVMRPAATTELWRDYVSQADAGRVRHCLGGINLIETGAAGEEAEAVSLIMRQAAETPGRTAALVTRDRLLARRVTVRLEAWGIRVDDSAGRPFAKTLPGTFLDLLIEAVSRRYAPVPLMALLKHPLMRLGFDAGHVRRAARALELAVFRTTYLGRGIDGIRFALERVLRDEERHRALWRVREEDLGAAVELVGGLEAAFAPLETFLSSDASCRIGDIVEAHAQVAEALSMSPDVTDGDGSDPRMLIWDGEAGDVARLMISALLDTRLPELSIDARDYPDFFRSIAVREVVRPRVPVHPRLSVWGPFEARLQQPDVVILGGLNEGSWPEAADPGPWLNRPMRQQLGLPLPEERIGYACHDFASLLGADQVYLTRSLKTDGTPTVPSRWLMRIKAMAEGLGVSDALKPEDPWLGWAANRGVCEMRTPVAPPRPCPPVVLRPRELSVSDVERWVQNPYAIFASKILRLEALPPLGKQPDAALRGSLVHEVLSEFVTRCGLELPDDLHPELIGIARDVLRRWSDDNRIAAFWIPRFERFALWFCDTEAARRTGVTGIKVEVDGSEVFSGPAGPFTLKARADRIDLTESGLRITDYKTKSEQGLRVLAGQALKGDAPQLLLEAAIAQAGGFCGVEDRRIAGLSYISASGAEPPGAEQRLDPKRLVDAIQLAREGLNKLISDYDDEHMPYAALRRPRFSYDYDDYAQLARVGEWSAGAGDDGGAA